MSAISRRVLDFIEDAEYIQKNHFPDGLTSGQLRAIASHHHIRITPRTLGGANLVSIRGTGEELRIFTSMRPTGTDKVNEDRGKTITSFPRRLIERLHTLPSRVAKKLPYEDLDPPIIVAPDGRRQVRQLSKTKQVDLIVDGPVCSKK
jgi:hypothetical protein